MGEGGNLSAQGATARGFVFSSSALFLILGGNALDLQIFAAKKALVMNLTHIKLVTDSLELMTKPEAMLATK